MLQQTINVKPKFKLLCRLFGHKLHIKDVKLTYHVRHMCNSNWIYKEYLRQIEACKRCGMVDGQKINIEAKNQDEFTAIKTLWIYNE